MKEGVSIDFKFILQRALKVYKGAFPLMISFGIAFGFVDILNNLLLKAFGPNSIFFSFLISTLLTCVFSIMLIYMSSRLYRDSEADLNDAIVEVKKKYGVYLLVYLGTVSVCLLGLRLFILPGVYLATIFTFSSLLVVIENTNFIESFKRSKDLVHRAFFKVLLFGIMIGCIIGIPFLTIQSLKAANPQLGNVLGVVLMVFFMPLYTLAEIGLYYELKKNEGLSNSD